MNIVNYGRGHATVPFHGLTVEINGVLYEGPVALVRLLTLNELERLNSFKLYGTDQEHVVEEDIIKACFLGFIGIDEEVDIDELPAGVVDTLIKSIHLYSLSFITGVESRLNEIYEQLNIIDSMHGVVSRFLNISYLVVRDMPVNEVAKMYAICLKTFPNEVSPPMPVEEESSAGKVGDNSE